MIYIIFILLQLQLSYSLKYVQDQQDTSIEVFPNHQIFEYYIPDVSQIVNISVQRAQINKIPPSFYYQQNSYDLKINDSQIVGCVPQQRKIQTQEEFVLFKDKILSSLLLPDQNQLLIVNEKYLEIYNLTFKDEVDQIKAVQNQLISMSQQPQFNCQIPLDPFEKIFLFTKKTTKEIFIVTSKNLLIITYDYLQNCTGQQIKQLPLSFNTSIKKCVFLEDLFNGLFVCISNTQIYRFEVNYLEITISQINSFSQNIQDIQKSTNKGNTFFVQDAVLGITYFQPTQTSEFFSKLKTNTNNIQYFSDNYFGFLFARDDVIYEFSNQNDEILTNFYPRVSTGVYVDDQILMIKGQNIHEIQYVTQLRSVVENQKSYIFHPNIKDVMVYIKYGYQPYLISTNDTSVVFHQIDFVEGHIKCFFNRNAVENYNIQAETRKCAAKKFNSSQNEEVRCLVGKQITVNSLKTYFSSDKKALAVGLGIGIPLIIIVLGLVAWGLRRQWKKSVENIKKHNKDIFQKRSLQGEQIVET